MIIVYAILLTRWRTAAFPCSSPCLSQRHVSCKMDWNTGDLFHDARVPTSDTFTFQSLVFRRGCGVHSSDAYSPRWFPGVLQWGGKQPKPRHAAANMIRTTLSWYLQGNREAHTEHLHINLKRLLVFRSCYVIWGFLHFHNVLSNLSSSFWPSLYRKCNNSGVY
jgi:hypothetical protein